MMRSAIRASLFIAATVAAASCGTEPGGLALVTQNASAVPAIRFAEIHYDNAGTDSGEAIEVSGPAGTDVTGWQVVLYNGTGGASYDTKTLSGPIPATCGARGVLVINYPVNGIQNGSPDGMALIDASGQVVEFLSYEGVFAATNGPANGLTSTDIGVSEAGTEPAGASLQRHSDGSWTGPIASTFGTCNDNDGTAPPPPVVASLTVTPATATVVVGATTAFSAAAFDATQQPITGVTFSWTTSDPTIATVNAGGVATGVAAGDATITAAAPNGVSASAALHVNAATTPGFPDTRFSELHYDNVGVDTGEAIEIEGPAGMDVTGWSVVLYDGNGGAAYNTQTLSGAIPATCAPRGVIVVNYPSNGIQNGSPDGMALVDATGHVVEFLSYEGTFTAVGGPADGVTSTDIIASESSVPVGVSLQRDSFNHWALGTNTFGACNAAGAPPQAHSISFSGRDPVGDVPLPVGFQSQLFATEKDASNNTVTTTFTWSSDTPDIGTVDPFGVISGLAAGTAVFRATAADGTTATWPLPITVAAASATASYVGNTEFGEPGDADPSDDFIVRHAEYTTDYNPNRGEPNWVSYDLNATDFGPEDRCNCFTFDPDLPATFTHLTTQDYTGAGAAAGFGIDRGHMTRSFDRTSSNLDNAHTFLLSNVVPQASDLNQGPWAQFEDFLGDLAMNQNKEVRIIAGPAGSQGTVKGEGKIVIPASTWKVAVIMDRGHGLADIRDYRDLQVIAVNMPNQAGVRDVPWQTYITTVDAIEALTGYDLLARLPDKVENIVEAGIQPPIAAADGPYTGSEGSAIAMSAAGSVDPNGTVVSYAWNFGDGTTGTGPSVVHTYAQDGMYTVSVTVTDNDGLTDNIQVTAAVANVAPVIAPFAGAMLLPGETYKAAGSFADPGADPWTATVDYGDGAGPTPLALSGRSFALAHTYKAAGVFTVTVRVSDDDTTTTATQAVTVISQAQAVRNVIALVDLLASTGEIRRNIANVLDAQLDVAALALDVHQPIVAAAVLDAVLIELDVFARIGQIPAADATTLRAAISRIVASIASTSGRH
jgi:DNA/RNA endonuclease G (NUC1)